MFRRLPSMSRRTTIATVALTTTALSTYYLTKPIAAEADPSVNIKRRPGPLWSPPSREQMLKHLKSSGRTLVAPEPPTDFAISEAPTGAESNPTALTAEKKEDEDIFDLLVVGGGATGAGVALDAASRGLKVACVEREDFSSGEIEAMIPCTCSSYHRSSSSVFCLDVQQEPRRNRPSSSTVVCDTCKRPSLNSITSNGSWSRRR